MGRKNFSQKKKQHPKKLWYRIDSYMKIGDDQNTPKLVDLANANLDFLESSPLWKLAGYLYWHSQAFQDYLKEKDRTETNWKLSGPAYLPDLLNGMEFQETQHLCNPL